MSGRTIGKQLDLYVKADPAKRTEMEPQIIEAANEMFKELYLPAEKEILAAQLNLYATKSKGYAIAPMVEQIGKSTNYDYTQWVNNALDNSVLTNKQKLADFLANPEAARLEKDPMYALSNDMIVHINAKTPELAQAQNDYGAAFRLLVEGLRESKIGTIQ